MKSALRQVFLAISVLALVQLAGTGARAADWSALDRVVATHCFDCHAGSESANGLDLKSLGRDLARTENLAKWVRVYDRVERGEMPPRDAGPLPAAARTDFLKTLADELTTASQAQAEVVLRRLNRFEYENTLRDLLGIRTELQSLLPEDGKAHGFDNVGEALDMSSVQLQRYLEAAGRALDDAIRRGPQPQRVTKTHRFDDGKNGDNVGKHWHRTNEGAVVFFNDGGFPKISLDSFRAPHEGTYRIRLDASAYQTDRPITFAVYAGQFGRNAESRLAGLYQARAAGASPIELEADLYRGDSLRLVPRGLGGNFAELRRDGPAGYKGPGLAVKTVEIDGPILTEWPGRGHRLMFGDLPVVDRGPAAQRGKKFYKPMYAVVSSQPTQDAQRLLRQFATKAFRRPVTDATLSPYVALAKSEFADGTSFEDALRTVYIAVLCAPNFLYLQEPPGTLDDYALASRLSYFLWSSLPDDELLAAAARGELKRPDVLRAQTDRLLRDPRAMRFTRNFVGQWLNLRDIEFTIPDKQLYPEFDPLLLDAMVQETERFFAEMLAGNRPVHEFIDSDWTMLNERLAQHYRIDGVLVDSYRPHWESWRQTAAEVGRELSETKFVQTFCRTSREIIAEHWGRGALSDVEIAEFDRRKEALYREIVAVDFPAMDGAAELIRSLHADGFRLAVGSSGPPENVAMAIDRLGVASLFQTLVTGADILRGKPDPQVFQIAAERLGVPPVRCAVIEDAPVGIAAANAAGMTSIAFVSTGHTRDSVAAADVIVDSLRELSPDRMVELISHG